jgi:hypothetical protein
MGRSVFRPAHFFILNSESMMSKWIKKCGTEIELNEEQATIDHANALGWKEYDLTEDGVAALEAKLAKGKKAIQKAKGA